MTVIEQIDFLNKLRPFENNKQHYKAFGYIVKSLEDLEKRKRKKQTTAADPEHQTFVNMYFDFYTQRMGFKPSFSVTDGKAIKSIIAYLRSITSDIVVAWRFILDNWEKLGAFIGNQTSLSQINKNINEILSKLKYGTSKAEQTAAKKTSDGDAVRKYYEERNKGE